MKTKKKNILVTLADNNYIDQAKQLFSSVYWNAGWDGDYMLLAHNIPEEKLKWFRDKGILVKSLESNQKSKDWYKILPKGVLSPVVILKYYLFTSFFKQWRSVIYLDSDIIVNGPLGRLKNVRGLGAVKDPLSLTRSIDHTKEENKIIVDEISKNYDLNTDSFNAGVLFFNTSIIKPDTYTNLMKTFEKYSRVCLYSEQTILNLYFFRKWKSYPLHYNLYVNYLEYFGLDPVKTPATIIHFAGQMDHHKPWNEKNYFYNIWKKNLIMAEDIDLNKIIKVAVCKRNLHLKFYLSLFKQFRFTYYGLYENMRDFVKKRAPVIYNKIVQVKFLKKFDMRIEGIRLKD